MAGTNETLMKSEAGTGYFFDWYDFIMKYIIGVLCALTLINNLIILIVMHGSSEFKRAVLVSVRMFYLAFAYSDLGVLFAYFGKEWIRMFGVLCFSYK